MKSYFFVGTFASRARVNFGNALADFLWKKWTIVKNGLPLVSAITSFPGRAVLRLINSEKRQDDSSEIPGAPCCTVTGVGSGLGGGVVWFRGRGSGGTPPSPGISVGRARYHVSMQPLQPPGVVSTVRRFRGSGGSGGSTARISDGIISEDDDAILGD